MVYILIFVGMRLPKQTDCFRSVGRSFVHFKQGYIKYFVHLEVMTKFMIYILMRLFESAWMKTVQKQYENGIQWLLVWHVDLRTFM